MSPGSRNDVHLGVLSSVMGPQQVVLSQEMEGDGGAPKAERRGPEGRGDKLSWRSGGRGLFLKLFYWVMIYL